MTAVLKDRSKSELLWKWNCWRNQQSWGQKLGSTLEAREGQTQPQKWLPFCSNTVALWEGALSRRWHGDSTFSEVYSIPVHVLRMGACCVTWFHEPGGVTPSVEASWAPVEKCWGKAGQHQSQHKAKILKALKAGAERCLIAIWLKE